MSETVSHFAVVDAIEEDTAVVLVDDGPKLLLNKKLLPQGTKESTVLKITITIDAEEQQRRVGAIQDLMGRLLDRTRGQKP